MSCFFLDAMREKSKTLPAWGLRCFLRRRILCCRLGDSQPSHQGIFVRICCCEVYPALKQTVHLHASWRCMLDPLGISLPESKSHVWKETCALIGFVLNPLNFSTRKIFFLHFFFCIFLHFFFLLHEAELAGSHCLMLASSVQFIPPRAGGETCDVGPCCRCFISWEKSSVSLAPRVQTGRGSSSAATAAR